MGMHIKSIDRQVICSQIERLEHLLEGEVFAVSVYDDLLSVSEFRDGGIHSALSSIST